MMSPQNLSISKLSMSPTTISGLHNCQSSAASRLCIFDLPPKLKQFDTYDIGGSYTNDEPDLWFFYTTSSLPAQSYLLNLFVNHRRTGNFSIGISDSSLISHDSLSNESFLNESLKWQSFKSLQANQLYHITTYNFRICDTQYMRNNFFVPISINMNINHVIKTDVINSIKLDHDFSRVCTNENTDFVLKSASGKEYEVHKIFIVSHCPKLRELIKNNTTNTEFMDISDSDMELLIEFIYSGTIKHLGKQDCLKLLDIAARFEIKNLFKLTELAISTQINASNAVDIAILSEKYSLEKLQDSVFKFIQDNQDVLETDGWKNLSDINLAKKLFQYNYKNKKTQ